ncbi:MAG: GDSL-type esterase/lipase family protein, partial [Nocardioides sp.]
MKIGAALVCVASLALATSCAGDDEKPEPDERVSYVAMGDSYAAAPGVPETTTACARSSNNYASLLAAAEELEVTDVTCSGASSDDLVATQVPELSEDTDLVTIGIGGNDFDLATTALGGCTRLGLADPTGSPCTDLVGDQLDVVMPKIEAEIAAALD